MGLMAPLYIAGLLGIALPILFHLIRRNPHGKQMFSSLMFLAPSPPRLTRRSRLTNLMLLLLRALALAALAFAFARPFLAGAMDREVSNAKGRRVGVLLDTSASMRRGDLWKQAGDALDAVLKGLEPGDQVALWLFDDRVKQVFSFDEWNQTESSLRAQVIKSRLPEGPGWGSTKLGDAVAAVADQLGETAGAKNDAAATLPRQLILISDMQEGSRPQAMQGHQWPDNVWFDVPKTPLKTKPGNASLSWVKQTPEEAVKVGTTTAPADALNVEGGLRVRISNEKDSTKDQFTVVWANDKGPIAGMEPVKVYLPAGRSQIVRIAWPPAPNEALAQSLEKLAGQQHELAAALAKNPSDASLMQRQKELQQELEKLIKDHPELQADTTKANGTTTAPAIAAGLGQADRLLLRGDDSDFDNTLFVVPPRADTFRVLYVGEDERGDLNGLRYYLESALGDTAHRKVEMLTRGPGEAIADGDLAGTRLVAVAGALSAENAAKVRKFVEGGGDVLYVMADEKAAGLSALTGVSPLNITEAAGGGGSYALISRVDVTHPLFAPFADARFGDFTKIHFWKHRRVKLEDGSGFNVLASFDDGSPFLLEKGVGKGWVRVMTSAWSPVDSQLALSTKFVPLMEGFIRRKDEVAVEAQYAVHETIALPAAAVGADGSALSNQTRVMIAPDGKKTELPNGATTFAGGDKPGIYRLVIGAEGQGQEVPLAVNLAAEESRTVPLAAEELDQWGAKKGDVPTKLDEKAKQERQLKLAELENRQKLWRWLILGVLGLLAVETVVAGRVTRRAMKEEVEL